MPAFMGLQTPVRMIGFYRTGAGFSNFWGKAFNRKGRRESPRRTRRKASRHKQKNGRATDPAVSTFELGPYLLRLTAFLSSAPAENFATFRAAILIVAPVCGLRPLRAFLWETEKVPKPINATRSPFLRAEVMLSTAVSMAVAACALLILLPAAIRLMRSALFIFSPGRSLFFSARTLNGARVEQENLVALFSSRLA